MKSIKKKDGIQFANERSPLYVML